MLRETALVLSLVLLAGPARAQADAPPDPEALAVAQELVDATVTGALQDSIAQRAWPQLEQTIRKAAPKLQDAQLAELKSAFVQLMDKEMKDAMADTPAIYARHFSVSELKDIAAFYRTATGKKTVSVMPAIMGEVMQRTTARMPAIMGRVKESFERVMSQKGVSIP